MIHGQTCFPGNGQGSTFKKHSKQSQWMWGTLMNAIICSPETEPKVAKKWKEYHHFDQF